MAIVRRFVSPSVSLRSGALLAVLPLLFTGEAILRGRLYGPADLYATSEPWLSVAAAQGAPPPANPILTDLAFANLPWRAALREAAVNGRLPLWNRFVLAGNPLLGTAQAGALHPATWLGLWLPVPLSFTFSCAFTLFLALLSAFLFFSDFRLAAPAALVGSVGWGFSTYVLFWLGWSVGPSTATFPLLLLGLRRLAREPGRASLGLTAAALWLSFCGGHPESFFHGVAAGAVYFAWELFAVDQRTRLRAAAAALGAGALALLLTGPQLFPLLEAMPHSAEYRIRREALARGGGRQSVPFAESARRMLPDLLPFAHGIYGKSPVQLRQDGSGMPLGYAGAVLFPLAVLGLARREGARGRAIFTAFSAAGLLFGASAPFPHELTSRLPGFALALNYRLVFLLGLGLAGLAAFGAARLLEDDRAKRKLVLASGICGLVVIFAYQAAQPVYADRALPPAFVETQWLYEIVPLALLGLGVLFLPLRARVPAAVVLLCAQRYLEMRGVYPTVPAGSLAPVLPGLEALSGSEPGRVVATGATFRPNGAALYGLEDVRGYESLVLDRFADTYPLWCRAQPASFNLVTRMDSPFLGFLNARWGIGSPKEPAPAGWRGTTRNDVLAIFENPRALPRAFVPRRVRVVEDPKRRLAEMAEESDFSRTAWLSRGSGDPAESDNGEAALSLRARGPDLFVTADVSRSALVATSLPDWPGWRAESGGHEIPIATVNHAFVGFRVPAGRHLVRLTYKPHSVPLGLAAFGLGLVVVILLAATATSSPRAA